MTRIDEILPLVQIIAAVALVAGVSAIVLDEFKESAASSSADVNQTIDDGLAGLVEITGWLDLIALAVIAGAIMTIVLSSIGMMYYGGGNQRQGGY